MGRFDGMLFASDLDGTLLSSDKSISVENRQAIDYFVSEGGYFTVATGRAASSAAKYTSQVVTNCSHIFLNGSIIRTREGAEEKTVSVPRGTKEAVGDIMARFPDIGVEIYLPDEVYVCQNSDLTEKHMELVNLPLHLVDLDSLPDESRWCKVNFTRAEEQMAPLRDYVRSRYADRYSLVHSIAIFFEMTHPTANKGDAVAYLAQKLEVAPGRVFTIGDNYNDQPMLQRAAIGFAPANADEAIQRVADRTVTDNDHSAVASAIEFISKQAH